MFKKFGKISFDLSFILMIGFTLASLVFSFMGLFITYATTWDNLFELLGVAFSTIVLTQPFITRCIFLTLLIVGLLFKDKIYSFITEKGCIYKKLTDIFSVITFTTALAMGACAAFVQFIYFCESFEGLNYVFEAMGQGGDTALAGTFTLGFKIATWVLYLLTIAIIGFFVGYTVYKFVKYVISSKTVKAENEVASQGAMDNEACEQASGTDCVECKTESESECECSCENESSEGVNE